MVGHIRMIPTPHDLLSDRHLGRLGPAVVINVLHGFMAGRPDAGVKKHKPGLCYCARSGASGRVTATIVDHTLPLVTQLTLDMFSSSVLIVRGHTQYWNMLNMSGFATGWPC